MKKIFSKHFVLIIPVVFFSTITFAQAPPDPGRDPLKSDSTIEIPVLQTGETSHSDVSNYLSAGKKTSEFDKISESLLLAKKDDKGVPAATE